MNELVKVEILVDEATAHALGDAHRLQAVGRLIDRMVRPGEDDPLAAVLAAASADAQAVGLTHAEIETELAMYNTERRV